MTIAWGGLTGCNELCVRTLGFQAFRFGGLFLGNKSSVLRRLGGASLGSNCELVPHASN